MFRHHLAQRRIVLPEHDALIAGGERLTHNAVFPGLLPLGVGQRFTALHRGIDAALLELVADIDAVFARNILHGGLAVRLAILLAPFLDLDRETGAARRADLLAAEIGGGLRLVLRQDEELRARRQIVDEISGLAPRAAVRNTADDEIRALGLQ